MANQLYSELNKVVSEYIGDEKSERALARQLERCGSTPDSLTKDDLKEIYNYVLGSTALYLHPDKSKQAELSEKIKALT